MERKKTLEQDSAERRARRPVTAAFLPQINAALDSRAWSYISAFLTILGISSFVSDLEGWRRVFLQIDQILQSEMPWVRAVSDAFLAVLDLYRATVHPFFSALFDRLRLPFPQYLYDWLVIFAVSLSAWARAFITYIPTILEKRRLAGQKPDVKDPYGAILANLPREFSVQVLAEKEGLWSVVGIFTFPFEIVWDIVSGEALNRKRRMEQRRTEIKAKRAEFRRRRKMDLVEWRARWIDILPFALRSALQATWRTFVALASLLLFDLLLRRLS